MVLRFGLFTSLLSSHAENTINSTYSKYVDSGIKKFRREINRAQQFRKSGMKLICVDLKMMRFLTDRVQLDPDANKLATFSEI